MSTNAVGTFTTQGRAAELVGVACQLGTSNNATRFGRLYVMGSNVRPGYIALQNSNGFMTYLFTDTGGNVCASTNLLNVVSGLLYYAQEDRAGFNVIARLSAAALTAPIGW